jgi:hypothetical protein
MYETEVYDVDILAELEVDELKLQDEFEYEHAFACAVTVMMTV